jgi:Alpha/beta hydrolase domain
MTVESLEIIKREAYRDAAQFGAVGSYERIEGVLHYAVDPQAPCNTRIVDLERAPRDRDGQVRFKGSVSLLLPADATRGNGTLLLDVPNRGSRLSLTSFNLLRRDQALMDPLNPGDGFLFRRGYALATVGWQWDVEPSLGAWLDAPRALQDGAALRGEVICHLRPDNDTDTLHIGQLGAAPYVPADPLEPSARLYVTDVRTRQSVLVPREQWRFARRTSAGVVASGSHVHLPQGFKAGQLYQLVFVAEGAPVVGCGLLAVRDAALWLRRSNLGAYRNVLGFGVSQTGRFLRQFLYEGLNGSVTGERAFDGMLVNIAGGQRGDFNHRFAQPSSAGAPSFGQLFPFATSPLRDPLSGRTGDLLERDRASRTVPKIFITNTAWEYWRGDASFAHIAPDGSDIAADENVRVYHYAGTQHIGGVFPPTNQSPFPWLPLHAQHDFSIVDHAALQRAALVNLNAWVSAGTRPPASAHPRRADGTAVARQAVLERFAAMPGLPRLDPDVLPAIRLLHLDPQTGVTNYPVEEGEAYPSYVSAVDDDGNEIAGIRLPAVAVPVATHTGWNPRHPDTGAPDQPAIFVGSTTFFEPTESIRRATADGRASVAARYVDRDDYLAQVGAVADALVKAGYVLQEDRELIVRHCATHYDWVMSAEFARRATRG